LKSNNISFPFYSNFNEDPDIEWQMSRSEKYCLIELLKTIEPDVSIEIGTYKGGSLQVLSQFSKQVYSLDISPEPKKNLKSKFNNVEFKIGESHKIINELIHEIHDEKRKLNFILIDGDHSKNGVVKDLEAILSYKFKNPLTIILHDSFNPQCREGIKSIDYSKYKFIEHIEIDYITGCFSPNKDFREMWGGFCLIKINPSYKVVNTKVNESQKPLFNRAYKGSKHIIKDKFLFLRPLKKIIYTKLGLNRKSDIYS
jgi:hypothetical protein